MSLLQKSLVALLLLSLVVDPAYGSSDLCEKLFTPAPGTLEYFTQLQKRRQQDPKNGQIPKFLNPIEEMTLAENWKGESGPALMQAFLPEGVTFISHQLRDSKGEGIVKDPGSGEFVMLRITMNWKGQEIGFNYSVPATFLAYNLRRKDKWLVGPEALAFIDWGHGGGTKTTGNHTSVGLMSHLFKFYVAVGGMDQPLHGEGIRHYFKDEREYLEFRMAVIKKYVHPDVPVIGVGHSKGGFVSDLMMRRSDDKGLNLSSVYKGFISLSGVVDIKPGGTFEEKTWAERIADAEQKSPELASRIAPGDLKLSEGLARQDKISPLSMMFVQFLNLFYNWTKPDHGGSQYLPTLYIWGEADYLYVGKEKVIEEYISNLSNTQLLTFTPRIDFKGRVVPVGHLIFDHSRAENNPVATNLIILFMQAQYKAQNKIVPTDENLILSDFFNNYLKSHYTFASQNNPANMTSEAFLAAGYYWNADFKAFVRNYAVSEAKRNGKWNPSASDTERAAEIAERNFLKQFNHEASPEAYTLVREFVEKIIGKKLEPKKNKMDLVGLTRVFQAYANILTFREFVDNTEMRTLKQTPELNKLNERATLLIKYLKQAERINNNQRLTAEQKQVELSKVEPVHNANGELLSFSEAQAEFKALDQIRTRTFVPKGKEQEARDNLQKREQVQQQIRATVEMKDELKEKFEGRRDQAKADNEGLTKKYNDAIAKLDLLIDQSQHPKILEALGKSETALMEQLKRDEKVRHGIDAFFGSLYKSGQMTPEMQKDIPPELLSLFADYQAQSDAYQQSLKDIESIKLQLAASGKLGEEVTELYNNLYRKENSLEKQWTVMSQELNRLEGEIYKLRVQELDLVEDYVHNIVPGYFTMERQKIRDLLNHNPEDWDSIKGLVEKAWAQWSALWRDRPPPETVELY